MVSRLGKDHVMIKILKDLVVGWICLAILISVFLALLVLFNWAVGAASEEIKLGLLGVPLTMFAYIIGWTIREG